VDTTDICETARSYVTDYIKFADAKVGAVVTLAGVIAARRVMIVPLVPSSSRRVTASNVGGSGIQSKMERREQ
jgi:uncharacterized membrane protein (DUF373 family)